MSKRKWASISILLLLFLLFGSYRISKSRTFQFFGEIVPRVETSRKAVALTFDDGPTVGPTDEILTILRESGIRATFFVTGAELEQYPEGGRKLVEAGHELGNHSYSHDRMVLKTPGFIRHEIERTDELIRAAGYRGPIHFRPPFGKKLLLLPYYLAKTGRRSITWDLEPDSYPEVAGKAESIVDYVTAKARPGSIILLHVMYPSRIESLKSVKGIAAGLKQQGYRFLTVSELLESN